LPVHSGLSTGSEAPACLDTGGGDFTLSSTILISDELKAPPPN
jgi:hypothetical protein